MPVETFTKQDFERALPKHKLTGTLLWTYAGTVDGEHCYVVPIKASAHVGIFVRSSVHTDGVSAGCGQDSIRAYIVEYMFVDGHVETSSLGSKTQAYVTRVKGWESRLQSMLRELYKLGSRCVPCPKCNRTMGVVLIKKGDQKGKWAVACMARDQFGKPTCREFHVIGTKEAA